MDEQQCYLGIELGSTRIKAVLIDSNYDVLCSGGHAWENSLQNGVWTYPLSEVHSGLQSAYSDLKRKVQQQYGVTLRKIKGLGVSAMMHGYLAFDAQGRQLAEFRTWRNTTTSQAAERLSALFQYNIPQRWSVAHLYQAILNKEEHVVQVAHINTLAGYIHWQLSGQKFLGIGDASGMFPIDLDERDFDAKMLAQFDELAQDFPSLPWKIADLLPKVLRAGQEAGKLSAEGAALLDLDGDLQSGIRLCPPEGDAGTGMVATNSVAVRTGNVSAGTSIFAMLVLERPLSKMRREIDLVTTPDGLLVAMAHCNNGSSDVDAWLGLFGEVAKLLGGKLDDLYETLFRKALEGDADCGGLLHYGYVAGEDLVGLLEGRPLFVREPNAPLGLANFMRSQLYSSLCALKVGLDILISDEGVQIDDIRGHGGLFKTEGVGQRLMAAAMNTPVTVLESAGEGGAWGIALLAAYAAESEGHSLPEFLTNIFDMGEPISPDPRDVAGFERYFQRFMQGLKIEQSAVESF